MASVMTYPLFSCLTLQFLITGSDVRRIQNLPFLHKNHHSIRCCENIRSRILRHEDDVRFLYSLLLCKHEHNYRLSGGDAHVHEQKPEMQKSRKPAYMLQQQSLFFLFSFPLTSLLILTDSVSLLQFSIGAWFLQG